MTRKVGNQTGEGEFRLSWTTSSIDEHHATFVQGLKKLQYLPSIAVASNTQIESLASVIFFVFVKVIKNTLNYQEEN